MIDDITYGRMVQGWRAGQTLAAIARDVRCQPATVSRWLKRGAPPSHRLPRIVSVQALKKRKARMQKAVVLAETIQQQLRTRLTPKRRKAVTRWVAVNQWPSAASIARTIGNVSAKTIIRDLRRADLKLFAQPCGPLLSAAHKKRRLQFCRKMLRGNKRLMSRLLFSDEKWFDSQTKQPVKVWARSQSRIPARYSDQGAARLLVLGFISKTRKHLQVCEQPRMDTPHYKKMLTKEKKCLCWPGKTTQHRTRSSLATLVPAEPRGAA